MIARPIVNRRCLNKMHAHTKMVVFLPVVNVKFTLRNSAIFGPQLQATSGIQIFNPSSAIECMVQTTKVSGKKCFTSSANYDHPTLCPV